MRYIGFVFPKPCAVPCVISGRRFNSFVVKNRRDFERRFPIDCQPINTADNFGGFLVDQPMVFIVRIFFITIDSNVRQRLARFAFCAKGGLLFAAEITQIPFVHNIKERRKLIAVLIVTVNAVGDSDKVNMVLTEHYLSVKACLQIISADSGHILHKNVCHLVGFNICNQPFPSRTVKVATRITVVGIVDEVFIPLLPCVAFEVCLLIDDRVAVPGEFIVTGQSLIQCCYFSFSLLCCHIRRSFQTVGSFVVCLL